MAGCLRSIGRKTSCSKHDLTDLVQVDKLHEQDMKYLTWILLRYYCRSRTMTLRLGLQQPKTQPFDILRRYSAVVDFFVDLENYHHSKQLSCGK